MQNIVNSWLNDIGYRDKGQEIDTSDQRNRESDSDKEGLDRGRKRVGDDNDEECIQHKDDRQVSNSLR